LKAYYVERNRLFVLVKNFPLSMLAAVPGATLARYFWHAISMGSGTSAAARFRKANSTGQLVFIVLRAHLSLLKYAPGLLRQRRAIRKSAKRSTPAFVELCHKFAITPRQVATQ
jgi:carotenoid cleavage dioxygenase-like enzyme